MGESAKIDEAVKEHEAKRRKFRQGLVQSYPYVTLEKKHLQDVALLPTRYDMLDLMPKKGCVCEIGVANGDFSNEIIQRCSPSKLHLVDAWDAERYSADRQFVMNRFADEVRYRQVEINVGFSTDVLPRFPDSCFDWIYIDSAHDYRVTSEELMLGARKVRRGGLIAGHDYTIGNVVAAVPYGVIQAVQEFCVTQDWKYIFMTSESHGYTSFALQAI